MIKIDYLFYLVVIPWSLLVIGFNNYYLSLFFLYFQIFFLGLWWITKKNENDLD